MPATRRHFLHATAASGLAASAPSAQQRTSPNGRIRLAAIGMGSQAFDDAHSALAVPGVELVAVADVPVVEDAVFGSCGVGPVLLSNTSYFEQRVCTWDPVQV